MGSLREEQRHLGLEVARLGRENEQLQKEIARRNQDTDALLAETALKEREIRRADAYAKQAAERLEQVQRTEQRLATAEAALAHCRKEAADMKTEAAAAAEQLALVGVVGPSATALHPPAARVWFHGLLKYAARPAGQLGFTGGRSDRRGRSAGASRRAGIIATQRGSDCEGAWRTL